MFDTLTAHRTLLSMGKVQQLIGGKWFQSSNTNFSFCIMLHDGHMRIAAAVSKPRQLNINALL